MVLNLAVFVMVMAAWLRMMFVFENGVLTSRGIASLKYFTVLSNLLEGAVSLALAAALLFRRQDGRFFHLLKYMGAVSVGLTFFTVVGFLGPLYGYRAMFRGANLWLHLVVPLLAMAEFMFLNDVPMTWRDNLLAVLPMLCYGMFYLANNLLNGTGTGRSTNDFYGFLHWGLPAGLFIFAALILSTFLVGLGLRLGNRRSKKE